MTPYPVGQVTSQTSVLRGNYETTELIDSYRKDGVLDSDTFVFDVQDPRTGYYPMFALSEDSYTFSQ